MGQAAPHRLPRRRDAALGRVEALEEPSAAAGALAIVLAAWALRGELRARLAITGRGAVEALALGVAMAVATHLAYRAAAALVPSLAHAVAALYASTASSNSRGALVGLTALVVIAEELTWRGAAVVLVGERRSRLARGAAITLLYALPQLLAREWLVAAVAIGVGAIFAAQRLRTGRISDAAITHAIWSIAIFVLVPLT